MTEAQFKKQVVAYLKDLNRCDFFVKEAKTIRGIADIIGVYAGMPFHLELKKNLAETKKVSGRIVLQRYRLEQACLCGTLGVFLCPENFDRFKFIFNAYRLDHCFGIEYRHAYLQKEIDHVA